MRDSLDLGWIALSLVVSSLILAGFTPPLPGGFQTWGWSVVPVLLWGAVLGRWSKPHRRRSFSVGVGLGYGATVILMILPRLLADKHGVLLVINGIVVLVFSTLPFVAATTLVDGFVMTSSHKERGWAFTKSHLILGILLGMLWNVEVFLRFNDRITVRGFPWSNGVWTLVEGLYLAAGLHSAAFLASRVGHLK